MRQPKAPGERPLRTVHHALEAAHVRFVQHVQYGRRARERRAPGAVHIGHEAFVKRPLEEHVIHLAEEAPEGRLEGVAEEVRRTANP